MTHGVHLMPEWSVDSLDTLQQVLNFATIDKHLVEINVDLFFQVPLPSVMQGLEQALVQL
jgi:hypothetical protein